MKIEKMSDTQIRVTLSHSDLQNRDIKIAELAYGSSKAQALFKDMMAQAYEDFGFETENVPLMIEAVPLSSDGIMIVVTKVQDPSQIEEKLDTIGERPTHRTFKDPEEDRLTDLELMGQLDRAENAASSTASTAHEPLMYCFNSLDDASSLARHIQPLYFGETVLYKYNERYFLILNTNENTATRQEFLVSMLDEFGTKGIASDLNDVFLKEHGHCLIATHAIDILAKYL